MNNFFSKPKIRVNRLLILSLITIVFEVLFALPFIILFQSNKAGGENTWLIIGNFGLILYPVLVYFGLSALNLVKGKFLRFSFLERLIVFMVFGNAVNFIIHLLTNIPEQFDLIELIQTTFVLFGINLIIRLISIVLFEPFNLALERLYYKLNPEPVEDENLEDEKATEEISEVDTTDYEETENVKPAEQVNADQYTPDL